LGGVVREHVQHLRQPDLLVLGELDAHHREQRAAGGLLVGGGVLEDVLGLYVEDARGVLGALNVATDPEHRLGDATQHHATPCV
jgi:hypothetical protein